jgi:filamentous hemagglutinin
MAPGIGKVSDSQGSVTRSGISGGTLAVADQQPGQATGNLNRDVTTGKDTAQALTKGWTGAQALDEVGAQMQITSAAMPRLAKEIGDYAATRVLELTKQGNLEEAAKWAEGGIYRVAAHAELGAMGGGLDGALGAAAAAEAAPTVRELQKGLQAKLADAGLGDVASSVAAKLIAGGTAAAIGGVVGGGAGAATGLNADANNRQLHESESEKLAALKQGKSAAAQHRLDAAACALVHCADGVPTDDAQYATLQTLQKEGQRYFAEQVKLTATGEFVYQRLDPLRDALTTHAELLHRTGGAINLGMGSLGTAGGGVIATGGAATCPETLGLGCAAIPFGAYIAKTSNQQAQEGSQALFGQYQSSEGRRVLNSFNPQTFPGEKDPLADVGSDALKLGATVVAGKVIPKALATVESVTVKAVAANSPNPAFTFNSVENPGPLATLPGAPAANFFSGKYNATVLTDDLVLYRAGEAGTPLGQWFTREAPESIAQVRIDSAVKSQWIDPKTGILTGSSPMDTVFTIKIPKGTTVYDGPAGYQGGFSLGGPNTNQVFVETPWKIKGVQMLDAKPIK